MIKVNTIKGYEDVLDIYWVDDKGFVFSEKLHGPMKECDNGHGYMYVKLKIAGIRNWKHAYVHILVAKAFVDNPDSKPEVNHKDENRANNKAENLEWVTRKENNNYGTKNERMIRTRCYDVYVYDYMLNYIGVYIGLNAATLDTLGYSDTKGINRRIKEYFFLDKPMDRSIVNIAEKSEYQTVVIENIENGEKLYFPSNRDARRFFKGKVNVTDAIRKNWTVRKQYKIYNLDYSELIDSPSLREENRKK